MRCAACDGMAAENARLRDELAEWRRQAAQRASSLDGALEDLRWRRALGVQPGVAASARLLVERAGRVVSYDALAALGGRELCDYADPQKNAMVAIHKLRAALRARQVAVEIQTVRGEGYLLPRLAASALSQWVQASDGEVGDA